ncbi:hypothetical protein [Acidaminococcus sp. AM05-11]|uniref:hypothetical protein n=1 Tax=Acidaminococcus sp. AM05-11 TaxID=2291997 RepID=UPI0018F57B8F|nr:hypothetical protein [Acidaminococcus sp. AM05-11]
MDTPNQHTSGSLTAPTGGYVFKNNQRSVAFLKIYPKENGKANIANIIKDSRMGLHPYW